MKFKHQFDQDYKGSPAHIDFGKSMTVPDMSVSIKTILENNKRGIGTKIHLAEGQYFDSEIPIFDDITDRQEYMHNLKSKAKEAMATANKEHLQKVEERKKAEEEEELLLFEALQEKYNKSKED